jgi:DNA-binding MurR/RpiR family transcriptional regulator
MTIRIELTPEIEAQLVAGAEARGLAPEEYAENLLRDAIASCGESQGNLSVEQLHTMLDAIAEGSDTLPRLPTTAFTRESFYEDRL